MVFQKKFENYYLAKIWKHYYPISQKEINSIVSKFGKKPMARSFYKNRVRIIYDETSEKEKPEKCSKPFGFYQIAIYQDILIIRKQNKHIYRTNKQDLMEFKEQVSRILRFNNEQTYMVSDKRFRRMNLSAKHFKIFKQIEHNLLHRVISTLQIKHYHGKEYSKLLWKQTAKSHKLQLIMV